MIGVCCCTDRFYRARRRAGAGITTEPSAPVLASRNTIVTRAVSGRQRDCLGGAESGVEERGALTIAQMAGDRGVDVDRRRAVASDRTRTTPIYIY